MEYQMILHEDKKLFQQAIRATAQYKGLKEIYIEKDYWVCYALNKIFTNEIGKETIFKGGTALSKCFNLVDRFSEDIDLVVLRGKDETPNQLKKKLKKITNVVAEILPEVEVENITQKMGMNRKTAHTYNKEFDGAYGQIRDVIIIEATWLGYYEPYTRRDVQSYIYEMMIAKGQKELASENGLFPFEVQVLEPIRTLCEKIMSLVRFSYTENPIEDLRKKIRHTYDLYYMLQDKELKNFLYSDKFEDLLIKVAQDDVQSFKNNNGWLIHHPIKALIFADPEKTWNQIKKTYTSDFGNLVYGELPNESLILEAIKNIVDNLKGIKWTIQLDL
jgi:hypothetical protein